MLTSDALWSHFSALEITPKTYNIWASESAFKNIKIVSVLYVFAKKKKKRKKKLPLCFVYAYMHMFPHLGA